MRAEFDIYLPVVQNEPQALKDLFARHGVRFGMACEAYSFDSSVQAQIVKTHCAVVVPEVSGKMAYTQPDYGVWDFSMLDALVAKAQQNGLAVFGHTAMWHMQNPDWLDPMLQAVSADEGMSILRKHVMTFVDHYAERLIGLDVINELGAVMDGYGWAQHLGMGCVTTAIIAARNASGGRLPLFYNSFYDSDADADLAIHLLPTIDGIGIQLHLETSQDYRAKFDRVRRIMEACKNAGKVVRISEVTVADWYDLHPEKIPIIYRDIIRLMKEYPGVVSDFVCWGVKYPAWNGRHVLFDRAGKPTLAFWAVCEELSR